MDKGNTAFTYKEILSLGKEGNSDSRHNMDELSRHDK